MLGGLLEVKEHAAPQNALQRRAAEASQGVCHDEGLLAVGVGEDV